MIHLLPLIMKETFTCSLRTILYEREPVSIVMDVEAEFFHFNKCFKNIQISTKFVL